MKIQQLTFTRFIAAISIVIYHYGTKTFLFDNFIFKQANVGVSYFFMLSGFVMIISYGNLEKIDFFQYLKNRLARIYPLYALAAFLVLASDRFLNINFSNVLIHFSMLQTWIPGQAPKINPPGWSLSAELFFYVTFPFFANRFYSKLKLKTNAIWIILFWIVSLIIFNCFIYSIVTIKSFPPNAIAYHPVLYLNTFLMGNLAGLFYIQKLKNLHGNYLIPILICLLFLVLALRFPTVLDFHNGLFAVVFIPLIIFISLSTDRLTTFFSRKEFVFLGEISFGIYILQFPVWTIFSDFRLSKFLGTDREEDYILTFFIRLAVLLIASILSYQYFEKPMRNLIKNYGDGKLEH